MIVPSITELKAAILCSRNIVDPDLVISNVSIVNVFTEEILKGSILIKGRIICGVRNKHTSGKIVVNGDGLYAVPAFIDAHIHIESSLLNPTEFAKSVIPHGTGAVITDFHELANVVGLDGLKIILEDIKRLPLKIFLAAPSCVPAAPGIDTSGAHLSVEELKTIVDESFVVGLGEMMNIPGVLNCDEDVLAKIALFESEGKIIDGHAPLVMGDDLQAYLVPGISTDHESVGFEEALDKLRNGVFLLIREGSVAKNMSILRDIIKSGLPLENCALVSDDKHVDDILFEGHLEPIITKAIEMGIDPIKALKMVTINPARHYGLRRMGAIAPGFMADIVLLDNLEKPRVRYVFLDGELVAKNGNLIVEIPKYEYPGWMLNTIHVRNYVDTRSITINAEGKRALVRVIVAKENSLITEEEQVWLQIRDNTIMADPGRDILHIVVAERHKGTGNIGRGFVKGFGFKRGAIASSVAHDSHNIVGVGTNPRDLAIAINEIIKMKGGLVVANDGEVIAKLELRLAGLMSIEEADTVVNKLERINKAVRTLGTNIENPFMLLSFMALPVIPKLKITDKGLFDVQEFKHKNVVIQTEI